MPYSNYAIFYIDQVERAAQDPLLSQVLVDRRPDLLLQFNASELGQEEYKVEDILATKNAYSQGKRHNILVKQQGYIIPIQELLKEFEEIAALIYYKEKYSDMRYNNSPRHMRFANKAGAERA